MDKIKVSEIGEVDVKSIEGLSYDELKVWIEARLQGKDTQIPSNFRQGDWPYYIISLLYPKLNSNVREDIHRIMSEFVRDMALSSETIWRGKAGHELLQLVQSVYRTDTDYTDEIIGFLSEMAESRQFFVNDAPSLAEDLHFRVLQTLLVLEHNDTLFWLDQYLLAPAQYASVVFDGLALNNLDRAVQFLSELRLEEKVEDILFTSFPSLLDDWEIAEVMLIIKKYLPKMQPNIKSAVQGFFEEEGSTLPIDPPVTQPDTAMTLLDIMTDGYTPPDTKEAVEAAIKLQNAWNLPTPTKTVRLA